MMQIVTDAVVGQIAASYFANNSVPLAQVKSVILAIREGFAAELEAIEDDHMQDDTPAPTFKTKQEIARSVNPDYIVSFINGEKFKTLTKHLRMHGFTKETYRQHFGLPASYPFVAPNYSAARSDFAKATGLGNRRAA